MKQIIVEIDGNGEVKIDALGFHGTACEKATKAIEDALGIQATKKKKPEYFASATSANTQKIGQ